MTSTSARARNRVSEIRLERMLGHQVRGLNNRPVGRLEEFRATLKGRECTITEYLIGGIGLFERLGVGINLLLGRRVGGYIARWDQLDISDPTRPKLTCALEDLRRV